MSSGGTYLSGDSEWPVCLLPAGFLHTSSSFSSTSSSMLFTSSFWKPSSPFKDAASIFQELLLWLPLEFGPKGLSKVDVTLMEERSEFSSELSVVPGIFFKVFPMLCSSSSSSKETMLVTFFLLLLSLLDLASDKGKAVVVDRRKAKLCSRGGSKVYYHTKNKLCWGFRVMRVFEIDFFFIL